MKQYLLSIYQPDGAPPPPEILEPIMKDIEAVDTEMRAAGAWVFTCGLHPPDTATVLRANGGDVQPTEPDPGTDQTEDQTDDTNTQPTCTCDDQAGSDD